MIRSLSLFPYFFLISFTNSIQPLFEVYEHETEEYGTFYSFSALARAAYKGHINCVELLMHKGANVEATDAVRDESDECINSVRGQILRRCCLLLGDNLIPPFRTLLWGPRPSTLSLHSIRTLGPSRRKKRRPCTMQHTWAISSAWKC